MQLSKTDTCTIETNHWAELLCALWRLSHTEDEALPGMKPLIGLDGAKEFTSNSLSDTAISALNDCLDKNGLFDLLIYETTGKVRHGGGGNDTFGAYDQIRNDTEADLKVKNEYSKWLEQYPLSIEYLLESHNESHYGDAGILDGLVPAELKIRVIPCIFMKPAPAGKLGYFQEDLKTLNFIFGYSEGYGINSYLNWPQWYRMGVWHTILYTYWMKRWSNIQIPETRLTEIYEKLPEIYISKVSIHGFNVGLHRNLASFIVDNLVTVYKVLAEAEVIGEQSGKQQIKWFYSLGRFLIEWFLRAVGEKKPEELDLDKLVDDFAGAADAMIDKEPVFEGPLGGCENPLWNRQLRLIFSPSVGAMTRRVLSIWFNQFWPVKPEVAEVSSGADDSWDEHCNLVFALNQDSHWLRTAAPSYYLCHETEENSDRVLPTPVTYVLRNQNQPGKWSRISIADDEGALVSIHNNIAHFSDWTSFKDNIKSSGWFDYKDSVVGFKQYD